MVEVADRHGNKIEVLPAGNSKWQTATWDDFRRFMEDVGYAETSPDDIHNEGSVTFIFTEDGELHYDEYPTVHWDLIQQIDPLDTPESNKHEDGYGGYTEFALMGRISHDQQVRYRMRPDRLNSIYNSFGGKWKQWLDKNQLKPFDADEVAYEKRLVLFWNEDDQHIANLLPHCCSKLLEEGLVNEDDIASSFTSRTQYIMPSARPSKSPEDVRHTVQPHEPKGDDTKNVDLAKRIEMWKKLHLMKPQQKKQAMKELGLDTPMKKNPWQDAMEKGGHITPGQKWWAPHSENCSFKEWLAVEERLSPDKERRRKLANNVNTMAPVYKSRVHTMKKKAKKI